MKKIAVRAMIVLAIVVALCMFFSGTIRTITTPKVRFTSARQGKFEMVTELTGSVHFKDAEELKLNNVPQVGGTLLDPCGRTFFGKKRFHGFADTVVGAVFLLPVNQ